MSNTARMLAVCDLLVDEPGHLDPETVVANAAQRVAGLTRGDLAVVAVEWSGRLFMGTYPRSLGSDVIRRLVAQHAMAGVQPTDALGVDARVVGLGGAGDFTGIVVTAGPIDGHFSALDEWLMAVAARRVAAQLDVVQLHRQRLADAEIVRDTQLAGELQRALMPAPIHRTGSIEIAGNLIPARQIGGDLYDVLPSGNDTVALVADVAGKGVAASLLTASVHAAAAHAVSTEGADPSAIVSAIEREIGPLLDRTGRIVTVAVAATDVSAGSVRIASAGHHPVVARTSGGAELVLPGAPPLGIGSFRAVETALPGTPGTVVVLASDGIVDQRRSSGEAYGIDRLLAAVERLAAAPAADGVDALFADVAEFAEGAIQDDDQTALVMRVVEAGV